MYHIDNSADNIPRQVVPRDFSFLSEADQLIVQGLYGLLETVSGCPGCAFILQGMHVSGTGDGFSADIDIAPGMFLFDGKLYILENSVHLSGLLSGRDVHFLLEERDSEPSPVFDEHLTPTVNCHKKYICGDVINTLATPAVKASNMKFFESGSWTVDDMSEEIWRVVHTAGTVV